MKEYRLHYLNDKEFEALSRVNSRYANTKDDAGFADMITNRIYVRKSGDALTDQFVTMHEIEEILAKNSSHEDEFNIRHKKGKNVFANILPAIAGLALGPLGPLVAGLGAAGTSAITQKNMSDSGKINPLGVALSGVGGALGANAMAPGVAASKAATATAGQSPSYVGQVLSGAQQALGFQSGAQKALADNAIAPAIKAPTMAQGFAANQAANPLLSTPIKFGGADYAISGGAKGLTAAALPATAALGFQGLAAPQTQNILTPNVIPNQSVGSTLPLPSQPDIGANFGKGINNLSTNAPAPTFAPGGSLGAGGGGTGGSTPLLKSLLGDNWRQTLLGASIPLLGQSAGSMFGTTPTPEPFTPEQSQLFNETAQMVRQGANVQLTPAQQQAISANYDYALKQAKINLTDRYKQLRPGSDIENDSQFRNTMVELERNIATDKANALAAAQLGLGAQQTQMMSELAAMDIQTLAMKAGIKYQEAKDFKDMLSSLGFLVARSGNPIYTIR